MQATEDVVLGGPIGLQEIAQEVLQDAAVDDIFAAGGSHVKENVGAGGNQQRAELILHIVLQLKATLLSQIGLKICVCNLSRIFLCQALQRRAHLLQRRNHRAQALRDMLQRRPIVPVCLHQSAPASGG